MILCLKICMAYCERYNMVMVHTKINACDICCMFIFMFIIQAIIVFSIMTSIEHKNNYEYMKSVNKLMYPTMCNVISGKLSTNLCNYGECPKCYTCYYPVWEVLIENNITYVNSTDGYGNMIDAMKELRTYDDNITYVCYKNNISGIVLWERYDYVGEYNWFLIHLIPSCVGELIMLLCIILTLYRCINSA